MTARPGRIADRTEEETRNLSLMVSLLRRPSNAWQQRRRYVMSARHHQAAAPQVGPEHWMPAPEVSAPTRPTRPSPAASSASISPAARRTGPSAPDCATGCGTSRAATAAGVCAAERDRQSRTPSGRLDAPSYNESVTFTRRAVRPAARQAVAASRARQSSSLSYLILSISLS
jgi:hypothetical protein